jgi:hypothetical protein
MTDWMTGGASSAVCPAYAVGLVLRDHSAGIKRQDGESRALMCNAATSMPLRDHSAGIKRQDGESRALMCNAATSMPNACCCSSMAGDRDGSVDTGARLGHHILAFRVNGVRTRRRCPLKYRLCMTVRNTFLIMCGHVERMREREWLEQQMTMETALPLHSTERKCFRD